MPEQDDVLVDLPAPNDAEPSSLRRDIADELLDHLQSAARRESLKSSDPQEVEHRVLARFGNPRKIARQLWLEAMKEKLMLQKVTLILVAVVAIASATACGLMWSLARDFQQVAADAQAASAELLSQGRMANEELLKQNQEMMQQLAALANKPAQPAPSMDWNPLKIRVVKNDANKTPAKGFKVDARGPHISETEEIGEVQWTDENGLADFGFVRPGNFHVEVTTPWGESWGGRLHVPPGKGLERTVIAPADLPKPIPVKPIVQWPKELEGGNLAVLVTVNRSDSTEIDDGTKWYGGGTRHLLIRPDGRFAVYENVSQAEYGSIRLQGSEEETYDRVYFTAPYPDFRKKRLDQNEVGKIYRESFPWPGREAALGMLSIVQLPKDADFPKEGETLKRLAPATYLSRFSRQYPAVEIKEGQQADVLTAETQDDGSQQWSIEIPLPYVFVTKTLLAPQRFPDLPEQPVVNGALLFFAHDEDFSNDLSEEEFGSVRSGRFSRRSFEEFPVSLETFVKAYVQSYTESSRSRSGPFNRDG